MLDGSVKLTGAFKVQLFDKDGQLKDERDVKNVIVTAGKAYLAAWLAAASQAGAFMNYVAIGTGTTGALATDTTLETEASRKAATTHTSSGAVWSTGVQFNAGEGTGAITEAGIFSAASSGTMLARQTFSAINKSATDSLVITWQVTIS